MLVASGCSAELWADSLPASAAVRQTADWLVLSLHGGEDYELCLGVKPSRWEALRRRAAQHAVRLTLVGEVLPGRGLRLADTRGARSRPLAAKGFDHF
jgi:thiamine-monophosphate kinase